MLSLMDLIKVKYPDAFLFASFINIVISVFSWIYQIGLDNTYEKYTIEHRNRPSELKEDFEWYTRMEMYNLVIASFIVYTVTLVAIALQFRG